MNRRNRKSRRNNRHPVLITIAALAFLFYILQLHVTATIGTTQVSISMMLIVSVTIILALLTGLLLVIRNIVRDGLGLRIDREATA
jgi:Ni/Fe-hydrogenase subunit HybB-like protein